MKIILSEQIEINLFGYKLTNVSKPFTLHSSTKIIVLLCYMKLFYYVGIDSILLYSSTEISNMQGVSPPSILLYLPKTPQR